MLPPLHIDGQAAGQSLQQLLDRLAAPDLLLELADRQRLRILRRTAAGISLAGERFRPYTPAWRRQRERSGASPAVNLFHTGAMLAAMAPRLTGDGVSLTFLDSHSAFKAAANQPTRPFFGFAPDDSPATLDDLRELLTS